MIDIVLIEPEKAGNIGAIARVMKNFEFSNLVLINPKVNPLDIEAKQRAKHAQEILKKAKIKEIGYLKQYDYRIATTAKIGTDYNIPRNVMSIEELGKKLSKLKKTKIAILIGREGLGLTNFEIKQADFTVNIPTSKKYPTLNISHSVAIILYEIFKNSVIEKDIDRIIPISEKEKEIIMKKVTRILNEMEFSTKEKKETQKTVWKRMIGKAMLTKREAFALLGFLKKLE